jgi:predicted small metal-binding protein
VDLLDPAPDGLGPRRLLTRQEAAAGDVLRHPARTVDADPVTTRGCGLGPVDPLLGRLEVDPRVRRQHEPEAGTARDAILADDAPRLREQGREARVDSRRRLARPQRIEELVPRDEAAPVHRQVDDEEAPEAARQLAFHPPAVEPQHDVAAQLEACLQDQAKVTTRRTWHRSRCTRGKEPEVGKVINCECGAVVRADSDDELVARVETHVASDHPDLVGKLSRDDVLGMAEEE